MLAYLGGPVIYPIRRKRFAICTQALFGAARITGVIPESNGTFPLGKTNKFAWSVGPGVDTKLSESTVLRVGADLSTRELLQSGRSHSWSGKYPHFHQSRIHFWEIILNQSRPLPDRTLGSYVFSPSPEPRELTREQFSSDHRDT
jgi:hypothetical protein